MLALSAWERFFVVGGLVLVSPEGSRRIHILDRTPPVRLRVLVDRLLAAAGPAVSARLSRPPRALATAEGEHAAVLEVVMERGAKVVQRNVGVIFGEDGFALIDGRVERPDLFAEFRERIEQLTINHSLGLGARRWRRFYYQPPAGWHPVGRPRVDLWLDPAYPRAPGTISVFHTRPAEDSAWARQRATLYEMLTGEHREAPRPPARVSAGTLAGTMVFAQAFMGQRLRIIAEVTLEGGGFCYPLRLETDPAHLDTDLREFEAVVASVRALPTKANDVDALAHWSE